MNQQQPDVSVIVLTYNVQWEKLKPTLESILMQEDVNCEIVMADDGSAVRYDERIRELCGARGFTRLVFSNCPCNGGTCKNLYEALKHASGRYVKPFSPGDLLYDVRVLHDWTAYMDRTACEVSFGDAVYYQPAAAHIRPVSVRSAPVQRRLFTGRLSRALFVDYLLANDTVLGAAVMMRADRIRTDSARIVNRLVYAEDYMLRIAVFEGRDIRYFARRVIWYEYGLGISTAQNKTWRARLRQDFEACNEILIESGGSGRLARRYVRCLQSTHTPGWLRKIRKCVMFPDVIWWRLRDRRGMSTPSDADTAFPDRLLFGEQERNGKERSEYAGN